MPEFHDVDGALWRVETISHGRTSAYLADKVHRPILQFSCLSHRRPRRYLGCASGREELHASSEAELRQLLARSSVH